ncbi:MULTISPECIES: 30S ribosomal protein S6 [unclassified Actinobaculum]|uniref:30S ribosomal protein S6 n=1 Tax=unclassified Actinobaculum TaxID=2609299 RepID=UPI000D5273B7|nr:MULTISPECIES: 30S ribosomal protein S6 [unclassified Actinobaculum]AWE43309.1 30S ribosomal protein S6 [Actinobaculum sp. 313]RTE49793.1 30S ribosomal protein S6 [Actinobaculum sp. 352]
MRDYEMMIILDTDVDERNITTYVDKLLQVVPNEGGSLEKVDIWGRRRLAYDINKRSEGIYVVVNMKATSQTAQELDRQLGLNESVLRTKLLRVEA